jgi:hypothetical protein
MKTLLISIVHYMFEPNDIVYRKIRSLKEEMYHTWIDKRNKCLIENLRSYNSFVDYKITIHLLLTEDIDCSEFSNLIIHKHIYDYSIQQYLGVQHKQIFLDNIDKYDYFLFLEDDILINEKNINTYINVQQNLPLPFI